MLILAIHTAGPACELALMRDGETLSELREEMQRGQDARLPLLAQNILESAEAQLSQLDRIAVITGPGSFTGVRVGVAFARGLALALKIPCIGITTLEAALPEGQQGSAIVALPAQKRMPDITYWMQTFRTGAATGPAAEMRLEDLAALVEAHPHMIYGHADQLTLHNTNLKVHPAAPSAAIAAQRAASADPATNPPSPTYARAPDAALPKPKSKV